MVFICCGSCSKTPNTLPTGNSNHYIGEVFGGGVVFHVWRDAKGIEHGLIIDKIDLSPNQVWSNIDSTLIGANARSYMDGMTNSIAIVNQIGHDTSAAEVCLNSTNGGYTDWYLPAIYELELLFKNRYDVYKTLQSINGATILNKKDWANQSIYYSSTEDSKSYVLGFTFDEYRVINKEECAKNNINPGNVKCHTRAVRLF